MSRSARRARPRTPPDPDSPLQVRVQPLQQLQGPLTAYLVGLRPASGGDLARFAAGSGPSQFNVGLATLRLGLLRQLGRGERPVRARLVELLLRRAQPEEAFSQSASARNALCRDVAWRRGAGRRVPDVACTRAVAPLRRLLFFFASAARQLIFATPSSSPRPSASVERRRRRRQGRGLVPDGPRPGPRVAPPSRGAVTDGRRRRLRAAAAAARAASRRPRRRRGARRRPAASPRRPPRARPRRASRAGLALRGVGGGLRGVAPPPRLVHGRQARLHGRGGAGARRPRRGGRVLQLVGRAREPPRARPRRDVAAPLLERLRGALLALVRRKAGPPPSRASPWPARPWPPRRPRRGRPPRRARARAQAPEPPPRELLRARAPAQPAAAPSPGSAPAPCTPRPASPARRPRSTATVEQPPLPRARRRRRATGSRMRFAAAARRQARKPRAAGTAFPQASTSAAARARCSRLTLTRAVVAQAGRKSHAWSGGASSLAAAARRAPRTPGGPRPTPRASATF